MNPGRRPPPVLVRAGTAVLAALAAAALTVSPLGLTAALLCGWSVFALVQVVWILVTVWPMDAARTRGHARREDPGRSTARLVALLGSIASLGGVVLMLIQAEDTPRSTALLFAAVALVAASSSWALIQIDFMLRLAAEYYADPAGGIDFNQDADPMYTDFAYVAFSLGVTFGVTDTTLRTSTLRRMVLGQALLSYLFGSVILATVLSLVTGL